VAKYKSSNAHPIMKTLKLVLTLSVLPLLSTSLTPNSLLPVANAAKLKQTAKSGFYTGPAVIGPSPQDTQLMALS